MLIYRFFIANISILFAFVRYLFEIWGFQLHVFHQVFTYRLHVQRIFGQPLFVRNASGI